MGPEAELRDGRRDVGYLGKTRRSSRWVRPSLETRTWLETLLAVRIGRALASVPLLLLSTATRTNDHFIDLQPRFVRCALC